MKHRLSSLASYFAGIVLILLLLILWEALVVTGVYSRSFVPSISDIIYKIANPGLAGHLLLQVLLTLYRLAAGYLLATGIGIVIGILMGIRRYMENLLDPAVQFVRPLPSVIVIPIAILFFGIDDLMKVLVIAFACTWPILINTMDGVKNVESITIDTARIFRLSKEETFYKVVIPATLPFMTSGMRISLGVAMILSVTAELLVGPNGMGYFLIETYNTMRVAEMYSGVFVVGVVALLLNVLFLTLRKKMMPWHTGYAA